jgi:hypothetical protein
VNADVTGTYRVDRLSAGAVTVTAIDLAGNSSTDQITIFFNQSSPSAVVTKFSFGWPLVTRYR